MVFQPISGTTTPELGQQLGTGKALELVQGIWWDSNPLSDALW